MYQSQASQAIIPSSPRPQYGQQQGAAGGPIITKPDRPPGQPVSGPHGYNTGGIAGLPGQWTPSMSESEEEEYNIRPFQLDPGIMSIEDLEDLFEEVGLDKSIIRKLINSGGLSQLIS